jgi:hypothetical protein
MTIPVIGDGFMSALRPPLSAKSVSYMTALGAGSRADVDTALHAYGHVSVTANGNKVSVVYPHSDSSSSRAGFDLSLSQMTTFVRESAM